MLMWTYQVFSACSFLHSIISTNVVFPITSFCSDFFERFDNTGLCAGVSVDDRESRGGILMIKLLLGEFEDFGGTNDGDCCGARTIASQNPSNAAQNPDSYGVRI
jgi:hypothetical protein